MNIDKLEEATVQDKILAQGLGIEGGEVERLSLFRMKNKLQFYAWKLEKEKIKISKEEADSLNDKLQQIIYHLENDHNVDLSADYWIDFNNYITSH